MPIVLTCPEVLASEAMSRPQPVAASAAATMTSTTPSGSPHSSWNISVVNRISTAIWMNPPRKMPATLPPNTWPGVTGAVSMRPSVPSRRSDSSVRAPNMTAYIRNSKAMPGAK